MATLLVIFENGPDNHQQTLDGLDFLMASTGYGHTADALFVNSGVRLLATPSDNETGKSPAKIIKSLPFFDVDNLYVCEQSLLKEAHTVFADLDIIELNQTQTEELINQYDHIVRF